MMKKLYAAGAAVLLAGGAVFGLAPAALADDEVTPSVQSVETVEAPAPAAEPETSTPTEDVVAPFVAESTAPASIALETEKQKHQEIVVAWTMPTQTSGNVPSWPQTLFVTTDKAESVSLDALDSQLTQCGTDYQVDKYNWSDITKELISGGYLTQSNVPQEDLVNGGWGVAYKVVHNLACPPPPPAAQSCVAVGDWYTEDLAPVQTETGLYFEGSTPSPVNWLHPVTGNFQGWTTASYTLADVQGWQTAYRFVVNPNAGSLHYASVSVEPYISAGYIQGQSGTVTIDGTSLAWSSKIASGPGSQSQPVPLSQFGTIWPDNHFISLGFHLGSTNDSDTFSTVTAATGCVSANFVPTKPDTKVETTEWVDGEFSCGDTTVDQTRTVTRTEYIWDAITRAFLPNGATSSEVEHQTRDLTSEETTVCPVVAEPLPPTFDDKCGINQDVTNVPDNTTEVTYTKTVDGNTVTVTATANEGFYFPEDTVTSWSHTFTDDDCPITVVDTQPKPGNLATTGIEVYTILALGASGLIAGLILLLGGLYRRRNPLV